MEHQDMLRYFGTIADALRTCKSSNKPDDHIHTLADACRLIAGGYAPVSEYGRTTLFGVADLLDYIAESETSDLDSPLPGIVMQRSEPAKPDMEMLERLSRSELLSRSGAFGLQGIARAAAYIDYHEATVDVDFMNYTTRGGEPC